MCQTQGSQYRDVYWTVLDVTYPTFTASHTHTRTHTRTHTHTLPYSHPPSRGMLALNSGIMMEKRTGLQHTQSDSVLNN